MDISELWDQAACNPGREIKLGSIVVCDICSTDYTDSTISGGFIFGSYAYCPDCAASALNEIQQDGEEHRIRSRCPENRSFADFVRNYRGADATISMGKI